MNSSVRNAAVKQAISIFGNRDTLRPVTICHPAATPAQPMAKPMKTKTAVAVETRSPASAERDCSQQTRWPFHPAFAMQPVYER